jgi:hypothetical protein
LSDYRLIIDHVSEQVKCYTVLSLMGLRIAHKAFGRPLDKLQSNIRVQVPVDSPILWIDMYTPSADAWHRQRRELCH